MFRCICLLLVVLSACKVDGDIGRADGGTGGDAGALRRPRTLSVTTADPIEIRYLERATLRVRLTDQETGEAVPNAQIRFELFNGQSIDLGADRLVTDGEGYVQKTLTAGQDDADGSIRITTEGAAGIVINVRVRAAGAASMNVRATYDGSRTMNSWVVDLFEGRQCDAIAALPIGTKSQRIESVMSPSFRFRGLASQTMYAARVRGMRNDRPDLVLASGCVNTSLVDERAELNVDVPLSDTPAVSLAPVPSVMTFSVAQASSVVRRAIETAIWSTSSMGGTADEAVWLVDGLSARADIAPSNTEAWQSATQDADFLLHVQQALDSGAVGPRAALAKFDGLLERLGQDVAVRGTWSIIDESLQFSPTSISLAASDDGDALVLTELLPYVSSTTLASYNSSTRQGDIDSLSITLPLGRLAYTSFTASGVSSFIYDTLMDYGGCDELIAVADPVIPNDICDATCLTAACNGAYLDAVTRVVNQLSTTLNADYAEIVLSGTVLAVDADNDGVIDNFYATETELVGSWIGTTSAPPMSVNALLSMPMATP